MPGAAGGEESPPAAIAEAAPVGHAEHWRYSPVAGVNLPQPLIVGIELWRPLQPWRPYAETGFAYIPLGSKSVRAFSLHAGVRYFPWQDWFFTSASLGYRFFALSADVSSFKIDDQPLATSGSINLKSLVFTLAVGGSFKVGERLYLGFDLGAQIPLVASGSLYLEDSATGANSDNSADLYTDSAESMGRLARLVTPQITLVRLTWVLE